MLDGVPADQMIAVQILAATSTTVKYWLDSENMKIYQPKDIREVQQELCWDSTKVAFWASKP